MMGMKHEKLEQELVSYYHSLLTESIPCREEAIQRITSHILTLIHLAQNEALLWTISFTEVETTMLARPSGLKESVNLSIHD